jgi:hypothetical protein
MDRDRQYAAQSRSRVAKLRAATLSLLQDYG